MEPHGRAILREHPLDHVRVDVDVEIHRPAKALNDGHRAAATVPDADLTGHMA